jgi:hypothetical protein
MRTIRSFIDFPERWGILILLLTHLLAAVFSTGFHHPDEHCQILEFANHAVGRVEDPALLRWEYTAQIRSWFQPILHAILMKPAILAGVYEPFAFATLFRILYGLINILALWHLWKAFRDRDAIDPKWFLWISLIWFFPYLHVRTSSENLSGVFLTFAAARMIAGRSSSLTGVLFGLAFLARYQVALGLVGLASLLLIRDRGLRKSHFFLLGGFLISLSFGLLLDRWFYGTWTLTPWNYFKVNLIDGVAATYSPHPWYQYFIWILMLNPLWSVPLFAGAVKYCLMHWKDGLGAFVWVFFLLHMVMTNKDIRFLFPVLNLVAVMTASAFATQGRRMMNRTLLVSQLLTGVAGLAYTSLQCASIPELWPLEALQRHSPSAQGWITSGLDLNPMRQTYYPLPKLPIVECRTPSELGSCLQANPGFHVMVSFHRNEPLSISYLGVLEKNGCVRIESTHPDWIFGLESHFPVLNRLKYKAVYRCFDFTSKGPQTR